MAETGTVSDSISPEPLTSLLEWCEEKRNTEPVSPAELPGTWNVFSYADVAAALTDHATYSSDFRHLIPSDPDLELLSKGMFIALDPPEQRRLRTLASKAFTPRLIAGLEPRITAVTADLLDAVKGKDRFDMVADLGYPLPVTVIAEMLGLPADTRGQFLHWTETILNNNTKERSLPTEEETAEFKLLAREMNAFLLDQIGQRRARPGEDLLTKLVQASEDGERLDDAEIVGFIALMLVAGHVTTTALLGNTVLCLDRNPHLWAELRADRALVPAAIEEAMRMRPPTVRVPRITTREVELGGTVLPAGSVLTLWFVSANRDAEQFAEPDVFDVHRNPNRHVSFGHGIHHCLGAPLSRLESRIALNMILDRYREVTVDWAGTDFYHPMSLIGPKKLPLDVAA
ncbi:cytochrome P450 [Micromonospora sp. FIMYZ51]|uniref:cytochrome P450 n=1 Tax=Micromonospora sp. FIMYZ51 TaxID=3051832 RepID=UPI00311D6C71